MSKAEWAFRSSSLGFAFDDVEGTAYSSSRGRHARTHDEALVSPRRPDQRRVQVRSPWFVWALSHRLVATS